MSKGQQKNSIIDFDVIAFGKSIFSTINAQRIRQADIELSVKNNPGAAAGFESPINTFFRIIGFQKFDFEVAADIDGYIDSDANDITATQRISRLSERGAETPENSDLGKDDKIMKALDSIYRPKFVEPKDKIIFPLVWTGEVPKNRAIAAPFDMFQSSDNITSPRCLLEAIIEIRVNRFDRQYLPPEVREYFVNQFQNLNTTQQKAYATFYGTDDISDYSVFSLILLKNFDLIVDKLIAQHYAIEKKKQNLSRDITYVPDPTIYGNPLLKNNNINAQYKRTQFSKLSVALENLEVLRDLNESSTSMIIEKRTDISRDAQGRSVDFVKDNLFLSPVMQVFKADLAHINRLIAETKKLMARLDKEMEEVRAISDLYYGTTSGLSIIDVFAVLWALFEIDKSNLLGLLNDDQFDNYNKFNELRGFELEETKGSLVESYQELERLIIEKINMVKDRAIGKEKLAIDNTERGNKGA